MLKGRYLAIADIIGRIGICVYFTAAIVRRVYSAHLIFGTEGMAAADVIALISHGASILFLGMICAVTVTRLPPVRTADGIEPFLTALAGTFLLGLIARLPDTPPISLPMQATGTSLLIVGLLASAYVLAWLGRAFSIMPEARKLIAEGPYSVVRHPLYLTEGLAMIGLIILHFSVWSVSLGIIQWLLQLRRMINEERVLRAAFPDYDSYAEAVPRVIPIKI